jgi:N-acetylglutamate synthase-like GNAT family acetyltransferase
MASHTTFTPAHPQRDLGVLLGLNIEYMSWVLGEMALLLGVTAQSIVGMPVADYVAGTVGKLCAPQPPEGVFYLIQVDGKVAGMCGLRRVGAREDLAEIKRLYVRPAYRGLQVGDAAMLRLLEDARAFGYKKVCLDTAPFMLSAQRLYTAHGFVDCAAYEGVEVAAQFHTRWRFMQRSLH